MFKHIPKVAVNILMVQEMEIFQFGQIAEDAYFNQTHEIAIWSLEKYIDVLNRIKRERSSMKKERPFWMLAPDAELQISHTRLALIYKKMDNLEKFKFHIKKGIEALPRMMSEEKLVSFVKKLDKIFINKQ